VKSLQFCRFVARSAAHSRCSTMSAQGTNAPTRRTLRQQPHFLNFREVFDDWKFIGWGAITAARETEMPAPPDKNSCGCSEFGRDHAPTNKPAARRVDGDELSGQRRGGALQCCNYCFLYRRRNTGTEFEQNRCKQHCPITRRVLHKRSLVAPCIPTSLLLSEDTEPSWADGRLHLQRRKRSLKR
jgi:hypothetical protein